MPRRLTGICQFEIQPVTQVPTSHESDSRQRLSESGTEKNGFDMCVPAPRSLFVSAAILCCWKYTWVFKEKLQFDPLFLNILTYFQIISLTKLYNFWVFCPEKVIMLPGEWSWPQYPHKNKNSHVFFNNSLLFMLVKVAAGAFFGWENQNIHSPDAFPNSSGRPARRSLHGGCNPSILTWVFHWPHSSREDSRLDASTFSAASWKSEFSFIPFDISVAN